MSEHHDPTNRPGKAKRGRLRTGARLFAIPCRVRYSDGVERTERRVPRAGDRCDTCGLELIRAARILDCSESLVPAYHEWYVIDPTPSA